VGVKRLSLSCIYWITHSHGVARVL